MRKLLLVLLVLPAYLSSQSKKPRLVVSIVVDQMRNDYLYRYWSRFSEGGFKRLVTEGTHFRNAHYNYIPTYTGPGHASIYTGATPRHHGIIGNDWYDKRRKIWTSCVKDETEKSIGTINENGKASPKKLLASTIGDELKLSTNGKGKVFSLALKDRSAILPAGHAADAAFWLDEASGNFISSTAYLTALPQWLEQFNSEKKAEKYLTTGWQTLYPIASYTASLPDDNKYEAHPFSEKPVFPYSFQSYLNKKNTGIIRGTPFGNSLTKDLAIACLKNENLGKDDVSDLFCISFSSTDIVGHSYGPRSVEIEDVYLRLDRDLAELLQALDQEVGKDNYVLMLTADHGGAEVPAHLQDLKMSGGYLRDKELSKTIKQFLWENYGDSTWMESLSNAQIFLNQQKINEKKANVLEVEATLCRFLTGITGIAEAYPSGVMKDAAFGFSDIRTLLQNGYNHQRSGNICYVYQPAWMDYEETGTTHGAGYSYDTHVPVIFYGGNIVRSERLDYMSITQIAPTLCELLRISQPNACSSAPLLNITK